MDAVEKLTGIIKSSDRIVAFTGAGVSTESSIPDFRSSGGVFDSLRKKYGHPPEVMLSKDFFYESTEVFFEYYRNNMIFREAKPNKCHTALAELERLGKLEAVVTQNIDGLHQTAGTANVIELHGSVNRNYCTKCGRSYSLNYIIASESAIPLCAGCNGIIKPDVVLYGEMLDEGTVNRAVSSIRKADVLLIMGTSLVVYPAAGLVEYYRGNKLVLVNKSETPYDGRADLNIHDGAGSVMDRVMQSLT